MKTKQFFLSIIAATTLLMPVAAQLQFPAPSPLGKLEQNVGLGTISVEYSRPSLKDRQIFGELVPYGSPWRTGANASTKVTFSEPVVIEGENLEAGTYSVITIPGETSWTVMFNQDAELRGLNGYDESKNAVTLEVEPEMLEEPVETLTFGVQDLRDDSATLYFEWEKVRVPMELKLDTHSRVVSQIKEQMFDGTEKSAGEYGNAAYYYYQHDMDLEQALEWMEKAIAMNPTFYYMHRKGLILAELGRKQEAREAAEKSIEMVQEVPSMKEEWTFRNQEFINTL